MTDTDHFAKTEANRTARRNLTPGDTAHTAKYGIILTDNPDAPFTRGPRRITGVTITGNDGRTITGTTEDGRTIDVSVTHGGVLRRRGSVGRVGEFLVID